MLVTRCPAQVAVDMESGSVCIQTGPLWWPGSSDS